MKLLNLILLPTALVIAGCASFEIAQSEIQRHLQSKETDACISRANYYLEKSMSFNNDQLAELYQMRGICYSQIGLFPEALDSYQSAINIASKTDSKARMLFTRATLSLRMASYENYSDTSLVVSACNDLSQACKLIPDTYCSEYEIRKYAPTFCK